MKSQNEKVRNYAKTILTAAIMIASTTTLFQGLAKAATAAEIGKKDIIPTNYASFRYPAAGSAQSSQVGAPEGYRKANYNVIDNALPYYRDKKPTEKDITRETAAELGAQGLWKVFGIDLEGKTLEMSYNPATEYNRAIWEGVWWVDNATTNRQCYFFSIDAVTGELHSIQHMRTLKEKVSTGFDAALDKNPQEYEALAKSVAEKLGAVHSLVKTIEYANQGSANNDPTIDIRVMGENGEQAQLSFSRHDKSLLSISFDSWCKEADAMEKRIEKEMEAGLHETINVEITEDALLIPKP